MTTLVDEAAKVLDVVDLVALRPGGQKLVYAGSSQGVPVVLKVISLMPPHQALVLERARREVLLLASYNDRRIVSVRSGLAVLGDPAAPHGVAWLEEKLDGADLGELLGPQWAPSAVAEFIEGLAGGLTLLHEADVVHRDLSPGNVRLRADGTWTLMDPGLAKHLRDLSITGVFQPGTPGYRSPEHVPGGTPGTHSDVFCVGILAFAALTGELPIDPSGDERSYFARLRETQCASVSARRADTPTSLVELVDGCLDRQPARRFLDAMELRNAAAQVREDLQR